MKFVKSLLVLCMLFVLVPVVFGDVVPPTLHYRDDSVGVVNMKTNDYYLIQFNVVNPDELDLVNCVPYLDTSYFEMRDFVSFNPDIFNMGFGERMITTRIEGLEPGRYEASLNVKCEVHFLGEFLEVRDLVDRNAAPKYEFLVSPAGEGQNYVFYPVQSYHFIARPGDVKSANFNIVNTGNADLEVVITPDAVYQDVVKVNPSRFVIRPDDRRSVNILVETGSDFVELNTNLSIQIGDYVEYFPITGERERLLLPGGAVTQNLFQGSTSAGNVDIPNWIVLLVIFVAGGILLRDEFDFKKTRRRRK